MNAIMIDIETLSLKPTALVTQIGFCAANLITGEHLIAPTNLWVSAVQPRGVIDLDTVRWWMLQSEEARKAVFDLGPKESRQREHTPDEAFVELREAFDYLGGKDAGVTVWASPVGFDLPILTNLWDGQKPWPYNHERDLMTLYKMLDPRGLLKPANALEHDAASDAKAQMDNLIAIIKANPTLIQQGEIHGL